MPKVRKERTERTKPKSKSEFKPTIKAALAVINAIVFLEKAGFEGTPKNIKKCIMHRTRKPDEQIFEFLPHYLSRGLELGILRRVNGNYRLGKIHIRKPRKKIVVKQTRRTSPTKSADNKVQTQTQNQETVLPTIPTKSSVQVF